LSQQLSSIGRAQICEVQFTLSRFAKFRRNAFLPQHRLEVGLVVRKRRRRFVATTDSDHDGPIFPNLARDMAPDGPNQLWVADITYVAVAGGFVYVAVILDAWSRVVVGYAISQSIDARLTIAALKVAIERRKPSAGCVHHSDRGSQYAAQGYRDVLADHDLVGSMGRRGNPYDNEGRELHEDAQGRGRLSDGLRQLCTCCREPSPLHR
jgi:transposase InsO family protein